LSARTNFFPSRMRYLVPENLSRHASDRFRSKTARSRRWKVQSCWKARQVWKYQIGFKWKTKTSFPSVPDEHAGHWF